MNPEACGKSSLQDQPGPSLPRTLQLASYEKPLWGIPVSFLICSHREQLLALAAAEEWLSVGPTMSPKSGHP